MEVTVNDYVIHSEGVEPKPIGQSMTTAAACFGSLLIMAVPGSAIAAQQQGCRVVATAVSPLAVRSATRHPKAITEQAKPSMTAGESLMLVRQSSGFNVTELAEIFGVSRPTIYSWLKGGEVSRKVSSKIQVLAVVMTHWTAMQGADNLSYLFDYNGPKANDVSIRDTICEDVLDPDELITLIDTRWQEYQQAAAISRDIIGEVKLVKGVEVAASSRKLNEMWSRNAKALKAIQNSKS